LPRHGPNTARNPPEITPESHQNVTFLRFRETGILTLFQTPRAGRERNKKPLYIVGGSWGRESAWNHQECYSSSLRTGTWRVPGGNMAGMGGVERAVPGRVRGE